MTTNKLEYLGNTTREEYRVTEDFDEWNLDSYKQIESLVDQFRGKLNKFANEATNEVLEVCIENSDAFGHMKIVGDRLKIIADLHISDQKTFEWMIDFEDSMTYLSYEFPNFCKKEKEWKQFCADIQSQIAKKYKELCEE